MPKDVNEIAEAIHALARSIDRLGNGNASTDMGAIEAMSVRIGEAIENGVGGAIREAIEENMADTIAEAIRDGHKEVAYSLLEGLRGIASAIEGQKRA